jgi:hypothetical protein
VHTQIHVWKNLKIVNQILKKTEEQQGGLERQPFLGCHGNARVYSVADVKD